MSHRRKRKQDGASAASRPGRHTAASLEREYRDVCQIAAHGRYEQAGRLYRVLQERVTEPRLKALIANDLGALSALAGDTASARQSFEQARGLDRDCEPARVNLELLRGRDIATGQESEARGQTAEQTRDQGADVRGQQSVIRDQHEGDPPTSFLLPQAGAGEKQRIVNAHRSFLTSEMQQPANGVKVAILSLLFNWPSTGGGIIHTVDLARFLARAGFDVRHFYARYLEWGGC